MTAIVFDLDGTLLDTLEDLTDGVNHALQVHGYPARTLGEVRAFVGNGAANLMRLSLPEGAPLEPALETYQAYYRDHSRIKTRPYPGIPGALAAIGEKYPLAIVSNKPDPAVKQLCADFFPGIYALGETPGIPRKPRPDMLRRALEVLGADRCVYVGDSEVDVITAANAGVPCLSVLWGFRDEDRIREAGGTHFCLDPRELPRAVEALIRED